MFLALFDDDGFADMATLARELRGAGVKVETSLKAGRLGKQFKYAERKGYRYVAFAGPDERAVGRVSIKDLETGEQDTVGSEDVAARVR